MSLAPCLINVLEPQAFCRHVAGNGEDAAVWLERAVCRHRCCAVLARFHNKLANAHAAEGSRLCLGKFCGRGNVPIGNFEMIAPPLLMICSPSDLFSWG